MCEQRIPPEFYEVTARIGAVRAIAEAASEFIPARRTDPATAAAMEVLAGLIDAARELLAKVRDDADAVERRLMDMGLH